MSRSTFVPNLFSALVDNLGKIVPPWNSFFQQFTQAPPVGMELEVTATPFSFTASQAGTLLVIGGTVTSINYIRGDLNFNITPSNIMPIEINDTVVIDYSVLPYVVFLPRY